MTFKSLDTRNMYDRLPGVVFANQLTIGIVVTKGRSRSDGTFHFPTCMITDQCYFEDYKSM